MPRTAVIELDEAEKSYRELIERQKISPLEQKQYDTIIQSLDEKYEQTQRTYNTIVEERKSRTKDIVKLEEFIDRLEKCEGIIEEYDYGLMKRMVENIIAKADGTVSFQFFGGQEVEMKI